MGVTSLTDNRVEIVFRPKKYNTQLVRGRAVADATTGRIMHVEFSGEYDMIRFRANVDMGEEGVLSLLPKSSNMEGTFKYLGNKIRGDYQIPSPSPLPWLPSTTKAIRSTPCAVCLPRRYARRMWPRQFCGMLSVITS